MNLTRAGKFVIYGWQGVFVTYRDSLLLLLIPPLLCSGLCHLLLGSLLSTQSDFSWTCMTAFGGLSVLPFLVVDSAGMRLSMEPGRVVFTMLSQCLQPQGSKPSWNYKHRITGCQLEDQATQSPRHGTLGASRNTTHRSSSTAIY
ncbi:hypothetical protein VTJ04DRAFT_4264 [Mycothermus thermophilus]|uniref:uncharacterized protein n=1 Tax=Humicola insolens TaxID=85995 RepID=UPI003742EEE5